MKTSLRARAGIAVAALLTTLGAGLVAAPLIASANADVAVNRTPTNTYPKDYFGQGWDNGTAMSVAYWCGDAVGAGVKTDGNGEDTTFTIATGVNKLVIHAGSYIFEWTPATAGTYGTPIVGDNNNPQAVSWAITCGTLTTSAPPTTVISTPPTSIISTPPTSIISTPPTSIISTEPGVVTSSVAATTSKPATTTSEAAAPVVETTSAIPSTGGSLAHTGGNVGVLVGLGMALMAAGAVFLLATRRRGLHA